MNEIELEVVDAHERLAASEAALTAARARIEQLKTAVDDLMPLVGRGAQHVAKAIRDRVLASGSPGAGESPHDDELRKQALLLWWQDRDDPKATPWGAAAHLWGTNEANRLFGAAESGPHWWSTREHTSSAEPGGEQRARGESSGAGTRIVFTATETDQPTEVQHNEGPGYATVTVGEGQPGPEPDGPLKECIEDLADADNTWVKRTALRLVDKLVTAERERDDEKLLRELADVALLEAGALTTKLYAKLAAAERRAEDAEARLSSARLVIEAVAGDQRGRDILAGINPDTIAHATRTP